MGSNTLPPPKTWVQTPCIRSSALSLAAGCNIYLKLETLQPSSSFKSRGVGNMMSTALLQHGPSKPIHFYCSSGGNAGLACATAANTLSRPATIVVPLSTSALMVQKLKILGADVVQFGNHWVEADSYLREELLAKDPNGVYVPPFDHEDVWEGNATLIDELEEQMSGEGGYDAVVCSVGGGGLFCGVMQGLERHGRLYNTSNEGRKVKVLALETHGADSLSTSLQNRKLTTLPAITSIATSLGAATVAVQTLTYALEHPSTVSSHVVTDAEAAMACVNLADDERILVESACGASVAVAYNGVLRDVLGEREGDLKEKNVVIIVCGGSNITLQMLEGYKEKYSRDEGVVGKFEKREVGGQVPMVGART